MNWLTRISTRTRLGLLITILALVATLNALSGLNQAATFQEQFRDLETRLTNLQAHSDAHIALLRQQVALKNYVLSSDKTSLDYAAAVITHQEEIDKYLDRQYSSWTDDQDANLFMTLIESGEALAETGDEILFNTPEQQLANASLEIADPQIAALETSITNFEQVEVDQAKVLINEMEGSINQSITSSQTALYVVLILLVGGMFMIIDLTGPLQSLTSAIVAFENNLFRPALIDEYTERKDELGQLALAVSNMASSITEANQTRERFLQAASRFIPSQYLDFLEKPDLTTVNLGDHVSAEMAVMFSDIRGFTSMSEHMTARENFDFVNEYLKLVSPLIQEHEGFIVKFLGDGMMAIFPYGVDDAVKAGIAKQQAVKQFNEMLKERGLPSISVGIGIHTGPMMVGMIGEEARLQGDAFSDNVNLTSRIEGLNKFYNTSMIISQDTLDLLPKPITFHVRSLGKAVVKGRLTPLGLYEVFEGLPEVQRSRKEATQADFERGIGLYSQAKFREAAAAFNAVLDQDPEDRTARMFLERCAEWLEKPAPKDWDGAIIMDAK